MAFPILWVLPYDSATENTMGFAMYAPMGFPFHEFCNNIQTALSPCVLSCYPTIVCTAQVAIVVDYDGNHRNDDDNDNDNDGDGDGDMYIENHCGGQRCTLYSP